mmetsp:Transcript_19469/g.35262  ORF Transcript_19469/g.35262 Transcript_19469/m.35262 type:complete len:228 (+) Transcript_19469:361-1044(+)
MNHRHFGRVSSRTNVGIMATHFQTSSVACPNGILDYGSKSAIFQFVQGRSRRSCGTRDRVSQNGWMLTRFHGIECTSENGMMNKCGGGFSGKSHVHTGINHAFHQHKNVGWSTARNARAHVDEILIIDKNTLATRREDFLNFFTLLQSDIFGTTPYRHATSNHGWRIGHASCHLGKASIEKGLNGFAGNDAKQDSVVISRHLLKKLGCQVLWFDTADNQVGILNEFG